MISRGHFKSIGFYFLLFFIVCTVLLSILEIFLRVYTAPFAIKIKGSEIILPREGQQWTFTHNFKSDKLDELITVRQNSIGFRGEDPPENFSDKLTIIAVGGSTTYNAFVSEGKTWIDVLGQKLKRNFKDTWINNAGFNGQSTEGHILLMEQHIKKLGPKVVLFLIGRNDSIHPNKIGTDVGWTKATTERVKEKTAEFLLKSADQRKKDAYSVKFKMNSYLKRAARQAAQYSEVVSMVVTIHRNIKAYKQGLVIGQKEIESAETIEISDKDKEAIQKRLQSNEVKEHLLAYEARVKELIRLSRDSNIVPVLITQPVLYGKGVDDITGIDWAKVEIFDGIILDGEHWWQWEEKVNDITRKVAENENLLLIDLGRKLPKSSKYYIDFIHYSNKGNEAVADIIYDSLCTYLTEHYKEYVKDSCNSVVNNQM